MAYLKSADDDEEMLQNGMPVGGTSGFLGNGTMGGVNSSKQYAPTSSGSRFVNLQRYMNQNPLGASANLINNRTDSLLNEENQKFTTATQPAQSFLTNSKNDPLHQSKIDRGAGFVGNLATKVNNLSTDDNALDGWLNSNAAAAPQTPSWSFSPEAQDRAKRMSNIETIAPELASDKSRYTPGMSALDQAFYQTGDEARNAINAIPGKVDTFKQGKEGELGTLTSGLNQYRSDEDDTRDATLGYLNQIYGDNAKKGPLAYDPTGKEQRKLNNISRILGKPNLEFQPQPWETTPEGKAYAAQVKKDEQAAKQEFQRQQKLPMAAKIKMSQIDADAAEQSRKGYLEGTRGGPSGNYPHDGTDWNVFDAIKAWLSRGKNDDTGSGNQGDRGDRSGNDKYYY